MDRLNEIVAQAIGVRWIVLVHYKLVAIVAVQAVLCAEPHEPPAVLEDAQHDALREPLFERDTLELDVLPCVCSGSSWGSAA